MMVASILVCSETNSESSLVSDRFARTNFYCLYQSETNNYTFYENNAKGEMSGAGGKAVKQISSLSADVVLVPEIGPKAYDALVAFELKAYQYPKNITIKEAIEKFYNNELVELTAPNAKGKH
jgi:predicted Fe-Mo cluster-binding NifX family protein